MSGRDLVARRLGSGGARPSDHALDAVVAALNAGPPRWTGPPGRPPSRLPQPGRRAGSLCLVASWRISPTRSTA